MELTALVRYGKNVRQVLLPCDSEEVAYRFGYEEGEEITVTIDSIEELPDLNCERLTLDLANSIAENLEDVDEDIVLSFIESESSDPKILESIDFDNCTLYLGVDTDYELGCHLESEFGLDDFPRDILERYFDYEKYGRDVRLEEGGSFVDKGYFVSR